MFAGPMFAGKTTSLINSLSFAKNKNLSIFAIKHIIDNRYGNLYDISTHDSTTIKAFATSSLSIEVEKRCMTADVIGIDEGQFFEHLYEFCKKMKENGKKVYVSGLDGTYQRKPFGEMLKLISISDSFTKLYSKSGDKEAPFTKRLVEGETILVGSKDKYIPVTRNEYFKSNHKGKIISYIYKNNNNNNSYKNLISSLNDSLIVDNIKYLPNINSIINNNIIIINPYKWNNSSKWCDELANKGKTVYTLSNIWIDPKINTIHKEVELLLSVSDIYEIR